MQMSSDTWVTESGASNHMSVSSRAASVDDGKFKGEYTFRQILRLLRPITLDCHRANHPIFEYNKELPFDLWNWYVEWLGMLCWHQLERFASTK
jgi:hypothetical protein